MTALNPQTVREIAREYILKQANYWNAAEIRQQYRTDPRCARLADDDFVDLRDAVINTVAAATVTVSWPDEQPQAEWDGDVRAVAAMLRGGFAARRALAARFSDRIAALEARDAKADPAACGYCGEPTAEDFAEEVGSKRTCYGCRAKQIAQCDANPKESDR